MPSYSRQISVPGKNSKELFDIVSSQIDHFMGKITASGKYEIERDPQKNEFRISGSMFSGTLSCKDSSVELNAKLSLLAVPFRSKIDEGIDRWVAKITASKIV